ncbi:pyridoxamine 5'-phosphate oxidase family protein [Prevotella sp. 10(H)]|uniref:pyridoxamine 5'-phosphate oxidase family protein n=1 Tax=Prevotella sp. 10(H) TaxID=1158294 RepID=UPI0004A71014|nr:pyridoxamine 5'-phosphate oxidase family protein [Prevotella sp. 10(H)]
MEMKLFYTGEVNAMAANDVRLAEEFIQGCEYTVIATNNKQTGARLSTVSNLPAQTMNALYFATDTESQKVKNIEENPSCEILYTDGNGQVILTGKVKVLIDLETKRAKWQDWMIHHCPEGVESEGLCILKFETSAVKAMLM